MAGSFYAAEVYNLSTDRWTGIGEMHNARADHTATLLPNGKVFVAGGIEEYTLNSTELYDPSADSRIVTDSSALGV